MNIHKDFRGYFYYHLNNKIRNVNLFFSGMIIKILCFTKGIKIGSNIKFYGIPSINRNPMSKITIGNNCILNSSFKSTGIGIYKKCTFTTVEKNAEIKIGNNVGFSGASLLAAISITIDDNVLIGAHSVIIDSDRHSIRAEDRLTGHIKSRPVHIKSGAWVGMNSIILKGVTIGQNAVIGANSVVTSDIPDNSVAIGNPCKVIRILS